MQNLNGQKFRKCYFLIPAIVGAIGAAWSAENYSSWDYSAELLMDTSPAGANVTGTVTNFPILLRLTSSNFQFAEAKGKGQDFRVAKTDGKHLAYQIERWDSANAVAEIWIKTDTIAGNTADQKLSIFWGNATAADSSNGPATFSQDYVQVWHLGETGTTVRANSVAGGLPATPVNYDGDESSVGMIGKADNFDGDTIGDYLDLGDGYTEFSNGLSFSVWMYPTGLKVWSQIIGLGNGPYTNNILVNRLDSSNDLSFSNYNTITAKGMVRMRNTWDLNQWNYITVTVAGNVVKMYRNGVLDTSAALATPINAVLRTENFIAKSNWVLDEYYKGKLDEPELAKVARSDAWVKLCYQNQKANQSLVTLKIPTGCRKKFFVPGDTALNEGSRLTLAAIADCATSVAWSIISGPAPWITDPEVKNLVITLPRVIADTTLVYRFMAVYSDSTRQKDVRVKVKEFIPDPAFTLPTGLTWSGTSPLTIQPTISNLSAIKSSPDSVLHWAWTLSGVVGPTGDPADTSWKASSLLLKTAPEGNLQVSLCLHNGGMPACKTTTIKVAAATSASPGADQLKHTDTKILKPGRDALGRNLRYLWKKTRLVSGLPSVRKVTK